jgi:pimeloyl-ACP methyl ester carboxylesterase
MMPLAHELARDAHVYVPDQPGFGGSVIQSSSPTSRT